MPEQKARIILQAERRGLAAFAGFRNDLDAIAKKAAVVGTAAAAALAVVTKKSLEQIDSLAKASDALRIHTEHLAGLRHGAELAGVSQDALDKALERQRKTIFDASKGLSTATDAIELLGLKTEDLLGLDTYGQFLKISDALGDVKNATLQAGIAQDIFGRQGQEILNLVNQGTDAIAGYVTEAQNLGIAINRIDAAKVEQANDSLLKAKERLAGIGNVITIELAPIIEGMSQDFVDATGSATEMGVRVRSVVDDIAYGAGLVGDAIFGWKLIFSLVDAGVNELGASIVESFEEINAGMATSLKIAAAFNASLRPMVAALESAATVGLSDSLRAAADEAEREYETLVAMERPSEAVAAALERWRAASAATAAATAEAAAAASATAGTLGGPTQAEQDAAAAAEREAERLREHLAGQLEQVRQYTLTREQIELEAIQRRVEILATARQNDLIDQERFEQLSIEVARRGSEELTKIHQQSAAAEQTLFQQRLNVASGILGALGALVEAFGNQSKSAFELHKKIAIAEAIVDTAAAAAKALRSGFPPANLINAAIVSAQGLARVEQIRSTTWQGSGSLSGGGGGASASSAAVAQPPASIAAAAPEDPARSTAQIVIHINAPIYGIDEYETAEVIASKIADLVHNRDFEIIHPTSLNAARIRGIY